jgi:hypothetical protein
MKVRFGIAIGVLATALAVWSSQIASADSITIKNNCSGSITVYVGGSSFASLGSGASTNYAVANGWDGRIQDNLTVGASLTEWNIDASGTDWYDVSFVDGQDNPVGIIATESGAISPNTCTKIASCPTKTNGTICESGCTDTGSAQYCCSGAYDTSASCDEAAWPPPGSTYVSDIHADCPNDYAYAYDDNIGLHTTPTGGNFTVTFCPAGSASTGTSSTSSTSSTSTTSTSSTGGKPANGTYQLYPQCATGSRLDDNAAATTNGNKIQIYASNGTGAQAWAVSSTGVVPAGDYNLATLGPYCLQASGSASGDATELWACDGAAAQSWNIVPDSSPAGYYQLQPDDGSGLCLDVAGAGTANGTVVQSYTCNSTNAQQWGGL